MLAQRHGSGVCISRRRAAVRTVDKELVALIFSMEGFPPDLVLGTEKIISRKPNQAGHASFSGDGRHCNSSRGPAKKLVLVAVVDFGVAIFEPCRESQICIRSSRDCWELFVSHFVPFPGSKKVFFAIQPVCVMQ